VKIDRLVLAGGHADLALFSGEKEASSGIDYRLGRHCLGKVDMNALYL
jgi:hypothetical protein